MASIIDVADVVEVPVHTTRFKPTAIISSNSRMAVGILFSVQEPGCQVPEDISVTDSLTLRYHRPIRKSASAPGTQFST